MPAVRVVAAHGARGVAGPAHGAVVHAAMMRDALRAGLLMLVAVLAWAMVLLVVAE